MTDKAKQEVNKWVRLDPIWKLYFSTKSALSWVYMCDIVTKGHPQGEKILEDFIEALSYIPIMENSPTVEQSREFNKRFWPAYNLMLKVTTSESFKSSLIKEVVPVEESVLVGGEATPITEKEMLLHIRRKGTMPLLPKDIDTIRKDLINYKRERHAENPVKETMKYEYDLYEMYSVYIYCNKVIFDCTFPFFLHCVGNANFSKLEYLRGGKTKIPFLIFRLNNMGSMPEEWYAESAKSIGMTKSDCSGKPISIEWTEGLDKAIKNKQK